MRSQRIFRLLFVLLLAACLGLPAAARAQSETPYDLVNAVNALRALHGLEPYTVDPWLMAYAQEHSEYQAAKQTSTHVHSDGTVPQSLGLEENVASGTIGIFTVNLTVYEGWTDWGHRHILTGYADGEIGAGVAYSTDGFVYYTVDIRPGEELAATVAPFVALETGTPGEDGSIVHVVGYGQTLWSIAVSYGLPVDEIRRLNGIVDDSTVIQPGQRLLIRLGNAVTPTLGGVMTAATASPPQATAQSTASPSPSPTTTEAVTAAASDAPTTPAGIGLMVALAVALVGLVGAAVLGLRRSNKGQADADEDPLRAKPRAP